LPRPLERERLAWAIGDAQRRALERLARAAIRESKSLDFGSAAEALFDLVARSELLPRVAPDGAIPRRFAARCLAIARERRTQLDAEAAALEIAERIWRQSGRAQRWGRATEIAARVGAPASFASAGRAGTVPASSPAAPSLREIARLARLAKRYPGEPEEGLASGEIGVPGTAFLVDRRGALRERPTIPNSSIVVGPPLRSERRRLRAVRDRRGSLAAARRFGAALALVDAVWPEAAEEVRCRTRLVLPLTEPGLVSFSLPSRPGVSFINPRGKTLVDLADDLLHETAHHRLHAIERRGAIVTVKARGDEAPRFWSPWRRAQRPARGIFHAAYTFAFRAELLARIAASARATAGGVRPTSSRKTLARKAPPGVRGPARKGATARRADPLEAEAGRERRRVQSALRDLRTASRLGLLTAAGRRLLLSMTAPARGPKLRTPRR